MSAIPIRKGREIWYSLRPDGEPIEEVTEITPRALDEKTFENQICSAYDRVGILYERQKRVGNGIIDIFVYGQPPKIIEVKRFNTPPHLMQAIVQLRFYGACFRKSQLYIAVPEGVNEKYRSVLRTFKVGEIRVDAVPGGNVHLCEFDVPEVTDDSMF